MWHETIKALLCTLISKSIHSLFTEKMDNLTKQLFDDVQKEEQRRVYEVSFALKSLLPSLSAVFSFASQLAGCRSQTQESTVQIFLGSERQLCESSVPKGARFRHCTGSGVMGTVDHWEYLAFSLLPWQWEIQRLPPLSSFKSKDENYCLLNKPSFLAPYPHTVSVNLTLVPDSKAYNSPHKS